MYNNLLCTLRLRIKIFSGIGGRVGAGETSRNLCILLINTASALCTIVEHDMAWDACAEGNTAIMNLMRCPTEV